MLDTLVDHAGCNHRTLMAHAHELLLAGAERELTPPLMFVRTFAVLLALILADALPLRAVDEVPSLEMGEFATC